MLTCASPSYFDADHGGRGRGPSRLAGCALTAESTGTGRATAARRSLTAGGPRPASCRIGTRGTTRGSCSISSALGSPTHPLPPEPATPPTAPPTSGRRSTAGSLLYPPHRSSPTQLSHLWVRFPRHLATPSCATRQRLLREQPAGTFVQQEYAVRNPLEFEGYGEHCWGFTACDGPGWVKRVVNGVERQFYDYIARGAPFGPDDGTVAPWVVVASLPFAPEIVIPTVRHFARLNLGMTRPLRVQAVVQSDLPRRRQPDPLVGHPPPLRHRPGTGSADGRELPLRSGLGPHAPLPPRVAGLRRAGSTGGWL